MKARSDFPNSYTIVLTDFEKKTHTDSGYQDMSLLQLTVIKTVSIKSHIVINDFLTVNFVYQSCIKRERL